MTVQVTHTVKLALGERTIEATWRKGGGQRDEGDTLRLVVAQQAQDRPGTAEATRTIMVDVPDTYWRQFVQEVNAANPQPVMRGDGRA